MDIIAERAKFLPDLVENPKSLLPGEVLNFYLTVWLPSVRFDDQTRDDVYCFGTDMYTYIQGKLDQNLTDGMPTKSDYRELRRKVIRKFDTGLIQKKMLIWPIHLKEIKHWVLAIVHNPKGAFRKQTDINNNDIGRKNLPKLGLYYECNEKNDSEMCRILIMDSLMGNKKYEEKLENYYEQISKNLKIWMQLAGTFVDNGVVMDSRMKTIVCRNLPTQKNSFDCGFYTLAFAEYFALCNHNWLDEPEEEVENIQIDSAIEGELENGISRQLLNDLIVYAKSKRKISIDEEEEELKCGTAKKACV